MSESLINKDRTWRMVICLNPNHETVKFRTNEIGNIYCPTCGSLMVTELKISHVQIEELDELTEE